MADLLFSNNCERMSGTWINEPKRWELVDVLGLRVFMDGWSEFWQKTYYEPPEEHDNGHFLYTNMPDKHVVEAQFDLTGVVQFDQAGLMVRHSRTCWLRAGLEYVDGKYKVGCVVTNGHSDMSTQEFTGSELAIRVYRQFNDFVVEYRKDDHTWNFIRICHLEFYDNDDLMGGIYACSPAGEGGSVVFKNAIVRAAESYHHTN